MLATVERADLTTVQAYAIDYLYAHMSVLPLLEKGQKRPTGYQWGRFIDHKIHAVRGRYYDPARVPEIIELYSYAQGLFVLCGKPSQNLFVIDCETLEAAQRIEYALIARDIPVVRANTARGAHFYLRSEGKAIQSVPLEVMGDMEVRGHGSGVVAAPSVHPSGAIYSFVSGVRSGYRVPGSIPYVSLDEIDFLEDTNGQQVSLKYVKGGRRSFHTDTLRYLESGHTIPAGSRHDRLFNAARDYHYCGYTEASALSDLLHIATASGQDATEARATIASVFKRSGSGKRDTADTVQQKLERYFNAHSFTGRTGTTDKALIGALLKRRRYDAHNYSNGMFRASCRTLATMNVASSYSTITAAVKRMIQAGHIERVKYDSVPANDIAAHDLKRSGRYVVTARRAALYRFTEAALRGAAEAVSGADCNVLSVHDYNPAHSPEAVLSASCALGKSTYDIYRLLSSAGQSGMTAKELQEAADYNTVSSVYYHTKKLQEAGLIEKDKTCYILCKRAERVATLTSAGQDAMTERERRVSEERVLDLIQNLLQWIQTLAIAQRKRDYLDRAQGRHDAPPAALPVAVNGGLEAALFGRVTGSRDPAEVQILDHPNATEGTEGTEGDTS